MFKLKLRGKIVGAAALVFVVALIVSLGYVVTSTQQQDLVSADQLLSSIAQGQAQTIQGVVQEHAVASASIAQTLGTMVGDPAVASESYVRLFEAQLGIVPNSIGIWALTVPGSAPSRNRVLMESEFAHEDGHFGPSITRDLETGELSFDVLDLSEENGFSDWFTKPLAKDAMSLVGPYMYDGKLFASTTAIIRDENGKGIGLTSVDFDGAIFADLVGKERPMGTGRISAINQDGNWVVHPDASLVGKAADDAASKAAVAGAASGEYNAVTPGEGGDWRTKAIKVDLPNVGASWTLLVSVPEATLLAASVERRNFLLVGALVVLGAGLVAFWWLGTSITRPISRLTDTMAALAEGDLKVEVQGANRHDELGAMARAVEVFRESGLKVAQMTEAEAVRIVRDQAARAQMMSELQSAFGTVVDAAVAGDFSKRVDAAFPDAELNALAGSINNLVETVDTGLSETSAVLSAIARAELTEKVTGDYQGAFGRLKADTNAVADKLIEIVGQLKGTSQTLKTATGEILSGANDLSERTTKQAATIEETSAAMEQLATTVLENAERARDASVNAGEVTRTAEEGGHVMHQATEAMERITTSSSKISNIIGMIDDIAFQTNLLALNASVEAARAGEAGKGFAVVAVEVRRLAQSAAEASSEVKALIEQSAGEVKSGSKLVADAAARLEAMLEAARANNALMEGIARQSREQASSIEEVNTAVRQMDEMTQHNAALVEEINAAIEQTETQATELDRIVDIFSVEESSHQSSGRQTPAASASPGIERLQARTKSAAQSYLSNGNAAVDSDWSEF